jgi:ketol-acid reductoisomerase
MAKDKIESLADTIINLTPQEAQKLQVVIKAKMMPEIEKQKALLAEQGANPQVQGNGTTSTTNNGTTNNS